MLENNMTPQEIEKMVDDKIKRAALFSTDKRGDTPTDDLQLVNKKYVDSHSSTTYGGILAANGVGTLPTGWSAVHNSTGSYTITHNLGTTSYTVTAALFAGSTGYVIPQDHLINTFNVFTYNVSSSSADTAFSFILTK